MSTLHELAKLLNLELQNELSENRATYKINEYQELYVNIKDWRGKGSASIGAATEIKLSSLYLSHPKTHESINFSSTKSVEAIAKDISRRLLNTKFQAESLEYIRDAYERHNKYVVEKETKAKKLASLGLEIRDHHDEARLLEEQPHGKYLSITAYTTRNEVTAYGMTDQQYYKLIKLLMSFHTPIVDEVEEDDGDDEDKGLWDEGPNGEPSLGDTMMTNGIED